MKKNKLNKIGLPEEYGLYDPNNEHENCGFGLLQILKMNPNMR